MAKRKTGKISTLGSQITSVVSVALVLLIVGLLASLTIASGRLSNTLLGDVAVIVKVDELASDDVRAELDHKLRGLPCAAAITYTPADEVLAQEMEYNAEVLEVLGENPYSSEYEIKLKPQYVDGDSIMDIANSLMLTEGVDEVVSQVDMVDAVTSATRKATLVLSCVAAVLLVISLVLIYNTVSIAVYARRFVIRTMQLVGATAGFIRRPFVYTGVLWGLIAAVLASAMLYGLQLYVANLDIELSIALPMADLAIICGCLAVLGMLLCGLAAFFATTRYLRASYDALYSA